MIRVLVAANSTIVRAGLEALVGSHPELELAAGSCELTMLAERIERVSPDVTLIEMETDNEESLPFLFGLGAENSAIVILADHSSDSWIMEALRAGVRAILPRQASSGEILSAVAAAAHGLATLPCKELSRLLAARPPTQLAGSGDRALTEREIEVLTMLAEGLGNKTIAARLGISEHTIKFHIGSIFAKLNASSRTEAVTIGVRRGLIVI